MIYHYYLIHEDGFIEHIESEKHFEGLEFYYDNIGCTSIETIRLPDFDLNGETIPLLAIVDEEGLYHDTEVNDYISGILGTPVVGKAIIATIDEIPGEYGEKDIAGIKKDIIQGFYAAKMILKARE